MIAANAFLDPNAGWFGARTQPFVVPGDTYDVRNRAQTTGASLGVVDDTGEARIEALLALPGSSRPLRALANAFCGPPDSVRTVDLFCRPPMNSTTGRQMRPHGTRR